MHELLRPSHNLRALSDTKHVNHDSAVAQRLGQQFERRDSREIKSQRDIVNRGAQEERVASGNPADCPLTMIIKERALNVNSNVIRERYT